MRGGFLHIPQRYSGVQRCGELAALLDDVADRVDRWTWQETWEPESGSPGAAELATTEVQAGGSPWG